MNCMNSIIPMSTYMIFFYQHYNHQHQHYCHLGGVVTSTLSRFDKLEMFFGKMLLMLKNISLSYNISNVCKTSG